MLRWGEGEWLAARVERWLTHSQGYTKLRSRWLSKGCQTMLDRPSSKTVWSRSDSEILSSLPVREAENVNMSSLSLSQVEDNRRTVLLDKTQQYDQDIADYIAYLNRPVINMNDHFIEIHQYHYDSNDFPLPAPEVLRPPPVRPPTRRKKHKIDLKRTEIVENKGMSTLTSPKYSEFLVRKSPDHNRNIRVVSSRSSDEENKKPKEGLDVHRPLAQSTTSTDRDNRLDTVVSRTGHVNITRGQTFSTNFAPQAPREFLSFRTTKKNKSVRRKKVVVSEAGIDGPIWPAVLLTFDRTISPGPPESPDESEV